MNRIGRKTLLRFALVAVFCIVPVAALFGRRLERAYPNLSLDIPYIAFLFFGIHAVFSAWQLAKSDGLTTLAGKLTAALFIFAPVAMYSLSALLVDFPIERMHLLKYGLLSALIYFARSCGTETRRFLVALLVTATIGIGEEISQIWIPERRFDFRDLWLNVVSALNGALYARLIDLGRKLRS